MWQISESVSRGMLVVARKQTKTHQNCKCLGGACKCSLPTANYTFIFAEVGKIKVREMLDSKTD